MLNRLMFCYFIQKKGFLDQDKNYLQNKLSACKEHSGEDKFYSFYRSFLIQLFHDGLGRPENHRKNKSLVEMGNIPYLNGGLFDVHELEKQFDEINIKDDAFEKIFDFFDDWNWHLDTRTESTGKDINPDVIGYIFEKYINDRAAMGAYYTKEDITDYIGKNTIIPFLFDEAQRQYKKAFSAEGEIWQFLKNSGDTYIYDAVKHGVPESGGLFDDLPEEIQAGFNPELENEVVKESTSPHLWEIRKPWNQRAPENIALPTEIYRELIERRKRYSDVKSKIENGEITAINDFITYNLNIRQFTQDFIETTADPVFIRHFYKALNKVTILDPTCGSGAFLFAAMNILEPLYETCIKRMEEFTEEQPGKYKYFEEVLEQIENDNHPNLQYFIFKSIILNNLYGVDIMKEAVEIAKLRLFLKLVATVDPSPGKRNYGMEPLPDIDFNIRAGNTLIGFATEDELFDTIQKKDGLFAQEKLDAFKEEMSELNKVYRHFQDAQLINNQGSEDFRQAKAELQKRLKNLNHSLNVYLATNYGIDAGKKPDEFNRWLTSHQPFHWFAEFYQIVAGNGGFDVIIGNPPYVEISKVRRKYNLLNFKTLSSGNLYAIILERTSSIISIKSQIGFIVPHAISATYRANSIQKFYLSKFNLHFSYFTRRPGKLFVGADQCMCILIGQFKNQEHENNYSTTYYRWYNEERERLFEIIWYEKPYLNDFWEKENIIPKIGFEKELTISNRLLKFKKLQEYIFSSGHPVYCHRIARYFIKTIDFIPYFWNEKNGESKSEDYKIYYFDSENYSKAAICVLNSSLFYWYWRLCFDGYHCGKDNISSFHCNLSKFENNNLNILAKQLIDDFKSNSIRKTVFYKKTGKTVYDEFELKKSKPIIDQIDTVLALHYGFTEEELDFIINYDIKYRMGKALFGEEENGEAEED
jgi:hypothetical protein